MTNEEHLYKLIESYKDLNVEGYIKYFDGDCWYYYKDRKKHRLAGPAIFSNYGYKSWYYNDVSFGRYNSNPLNICNYTQEQFERDIRLIAFR